MEKPETSRFSKNGIAGAGQGPFDVLGFQTKATLQFAFERFARRTNVSSYDYFEFGVYTGYSLVSAYMEAVRYELDQMRFYGFDSFLGLPTIEPIDRGDPFFFEGNFCCSEQRVRHNLTWAEVELSRFELINGWYAQTLNDRLVEQLGARNAGVILVDCDLYHSTVPVLNFIRHFIRREAIIIFDDWDHYPWAPLLGERKAFHEFLEMYPCFSATELATIGAAKVFSLRRSDMT